ncbi:hypothetical protein P7266_0215 [Lactococcus cremoris]|nr:hypothetical protein P7266_0215 [Lactococcus cremoris]
MYDSSQLTVFTDEWVSECKKSQLKIKKPLLNELKIFSKES